MAPVHAGPARASRMARGTLTPLPGTLYRVVARLMADDLVAEVQPAHAPPPHPGLPRKYYGLTPAGRQALAAEARRLKTSARRAEAVSAR